MPSNRGIMLVLSSPSGAGKTSICKHLLSSEPNLKMSVSVTTRAMRPGEIDGKDYLFINSQKFQQKLANEDFLEHAYVFGNFYGTPKSDIFALLEQGIDVLFDIDWQGTQQLAQVSCDMVSVFILPPNIEELERRLNTRAQDNPDTIKKRMTCAANEISHWAEYDYVVINNDLDHSVAQVRAILTAERLKRTRQVGLADFTKKLRKIEENKQLCCSK